MRTFAESPVCAVTSRLKLMGKAGSREGFSPDYSILENPSDHSVFISAMSLVKQFLIRKPELRTTVKNGEYLYDVFPDRSTFTMTQPSFLIRDPIRVSDG